MARRIEIHPHQPPTSCQLLVDHRIDFTLAADDSTQNIGEEDAIGAGQHLVSIVAGKPVIEKLGNDVVEVRSGEIHLIKRLHGRDTGGCPCRNLSRFRFRVGRHAGAPQNARFVSIRRAHARTASPPLPLMPPSARAIACAWVSTVNMALPTGTSLRTAVSISQ